jgi:hypothetical protein
MARVPSLFFFAVVGGGVYAGCSPDLDFLSSVYEPSGGTTSAAGKAGSGGRGGRAGASGSSGSTGEAGSDDPGGMGPGASGGTAGSSAGAGTSGSGGAGRAGSGGVAGGLGGEAGEGAGGTPDAGTGGEAGEASGAGGAGGEPAMCEPGFSTCPGGLECATDLAVGDVAGATTTHCGDCGVTCSLNHASSSSCAQGVCAPACVSRYVSCNAETNDACEVHLDDLDRCASTCTDGIACDPLQVCNTGTCVAPQGLVVLSVPMNVTPERQRYADRFTPYPNLEGQAVTFRLYAPGATGGSFVVYMTDSTDSSFSPQASFALSGMSAGWTDIEVPVPPSAGGYDATSLFQVTFEVVVDGTGPWTDPTLIYIDRIWSSNLAVNDTFDTSRGQVIESSLEQIAGSSMTWVEAMP